MGGADAVQALAALSHCRTLRGDQQRRVDAGFARLLFRVVDGVRYSLSGLPSQSENQNRDHESLHTTSLSGAINAQFRCHPHGHVDDTIVAVPEVLPLLRQRTWPSGK